MCGSSDVKMQSDGTNNVFRVLFRESVELQPNTNYTAAATLSVSTALCMTLTPNPTFVTFC